MIERTSAAITSQLKKGHFSGEKKQKNKIYCNRAIGNFELGTIAKDTIDNQQYN